MLELGNFATPAIGVGGEEDGHHQQTYWYDPEMVWQVFQPFPGESGQTRGQQDKKQQRQAPKLGFFSFQMTRRTHGLLLVL